MTLEQRRYYIMCNGIIPQEVEHLYCNLSYFYDTSNDTEYDKYIRYWVRRNNQARELEKQYEQEQKNKACLDDELEKIFSNQIESILFNILGAK